MIAHYVKTDFNGDGHRRGDKKYKLHNTIVALWCGMHGLHLFSKVNGEEIHCAKIFYMRHLRTLKMLPKLRQTRKLLWEVLKTSGE